MQAYSDPRRESDPHSLPDVEVFYVDADEASKHEEEMTEPGWYWWPCFPGCLPDDNATGPFKTREEALEDAQDWE